MRSPKFTCVRKRASLCVGWVLLSMFASMAIYGLVGCAARTTVDDCPFATNHGNDRTWIRASNRDGDDHSIVSDQDIAARLEVEGGELIESKRAKPSEELAAGLGRAHADLPPDSVMTRVGGSPMDLPTLYRMACEGVLVVASIYQCDSCDQWHTAGGATAFVLSRDGLCVTNHHVLAEHEHEHTLYPFVMAHDGTVFSIEKILASNEEDDVAIFRLGAGKRDGRSIAIDEARLTPIPLVEGSPVGTPIALIAHPDRLFYTMTSGIISRRITNESIMPGETRTDEVSVTCDYAVGSSGGPILDDRGRAVGMVMATHTIFAGKGRSREPQMVVRKCVPAERILDVISKEGRVEGRGIVP
ncbi:MAG: serine protease [Phycisphaerales bacterium]